MDGAQLASIDIATHKARAAVKFRRETKVFETNVQTGNVYQLTLDDVVVRAAAFRWSVRASWSAPSAARAALVASAQAKRRGGVQGRSDWRNHPGVRDDHVENPVRDSSRPRS
jgi:hypothetical protein